MRRRAKLADLTMPPPELVTFRQGDWAAFAPDFDERVDTPYTSATEAERKIQREFQVWADARHRWRDAHGWPTDGIEFILEQRGARSALFITADSEDP